MRYAFLWLLLAATPSMAQEGAKAPIPDEQAQKAAAALVAEVFRPDYEQAKTPAQKIALAKKLLQEGTATKDDPTGRYVLFRVARDVAAQQGDLLTALEAIDKIAAEFAIDKLPLQVAAATAASNAKGAKDDQACAVLLISLIDQAVVIDRYADAQVLASSALRFAREARDADSIKSLTTRAGEIESIAAEYVGIQEALKTLAEKPTDPAANAAVGKFRCLIKGDWERGITMLALGSDAALKAIALLELAETPDALQIGDGWWKIAEGLQDRAKANAQQHAADWHRRALPSLTGLSKARVERQLAEFSDKEATDAAVANAGSGSTNSSADSLAQRFAGTYQVVALKGKENIRRDSFMDFLPDSTVTDEGTHVGSWKAENGKVVVAFSSSQRTALISPSKDGFTGQITDEDGKTWRLSALRVVLVATWEHRAGNNAPGNIKLWSNGRIGAPDGRARWTLKGNQLTLSWPEGWIDRCTISPDGRRYQGKNQSGVIITGKRIEP